MVERKSQQLNDRHFYSFRRLFEWYVDIVVCIAVYLGVKKCVRACTLPRPLIIPAKNICAFVNGFDMSLEFELYLFVDSVANETRASFKSTMLLNLAFVLWMRKTSSSPLINGSFCGAVVTPTTTTMTTTTMEAVAIKSKCVSYIPCNVNL